jgi:hypothetical protein
VVVEHRTVEGAPPQLIRRVDCRRIVLGSGLVRDSFIVIGSSGVLDGSTRLEHASRTGVC